MGWQEQVLRGQGMTSFFGAFSPAEEKKRIICNCKWRSCERSARKEKTSERKSRRGERELIIAWKLSLLPVYQLNLSCLVRCCVMGQQTVRINLKLIGFWGDRRQPTAGTASWTSLKLLRTQYWLAQGWSATATSHAGDTGRESVTPNFSLVKNSDSYQHGPLAQSGVFKVQPLTGEGLHIYFELHGLEEDKSKEPAGAITCGVMYIHHILNFCILFRGPR